MLIKEPVYRVGLIGALIETLLNRKVLAIYLQSN